MQKKMKLQSPNNIFSDWTKKYSLSKTLRFELKPVDENLKPIKDIKQRFCELIKKDSQRAEDYKILKQIIDEYHKNYIEKSLSKTNILNVNDMEEFEKLLSQSKSRKEDERLKKQIKEKQKNLRRQITDQFKNTDQELKNQIAQQKNSGKKQKSSQKNKDKKSNKSPLFEQEFIAKILPQWLENHPQAIKKQDIKKVDITLEQAKEIIKKFDKFTTYLKGFNENRKNIYSSEEKSTAISHRIINENFPRFLSNREAGKKITDNFPDLKKQLENLKIDMKEEFKALGAANIHDLFKISYFNKCLTQKGIDSYNSIIGGKTLNNEQKVQGVNERINLYRQEKKQKAANNSSKQKNEVVSINLSSNKLPLMQTLHKQILSDRQSHSVNWLEEFESRTEVLSAIETLWKSIQEDKNQQNLSVLKRAEKLFTSFLHQTILNFDKRSPVNKESSQSESLGRAGDNCDLNKIYFKTSELDKLSHKLFGDWSIIKSAIQSSYNNIKNILDEYKKSLQKKEKTEWDKKIKTDFSNFKKEFEKAHQRWLEQLEKKSHIVKPGDSLLSSYFETQLANKSKSNLKDFFSFEEIHQFLDLYLKDIDTIEDNKPSQSSDPDTDKTRGKKSKLSDDEGLDHSEKIKEIKRLLKEGKIKNILLYYFRSEFQDKKSLSYYLKPLDQEKSGSQPVPTEKEKRPTVKGFTNSNQSETNQNNKKLLSHIQDLYQSVQQIPDSEEKFNPEETKKIQDFLQMLIHLFHLIKPINLEKDKKSIEDIDKDPIFYNEFESLYKSLKEIIPLYNKTRNHIAKNKNHLNKIKTNFEHSNLLGGWDLNKEKDYLSVILRKKEQDEWLYYLGVMNKEKQGANKTFDYHLKEEDSEKEKTKKNLLKKKIMAQETEEHFEKMNYKQISSAKKDIQNLMIINGEVCRKTTNLDELKKEHLPSEIWDIKKSASYKKGDNFKKNDLSKFIKFYQDIAKKYWKEKEFDLHFKQAKNYEDFKEFTDHIDAQGYKLSFVDKIKTDYIKEKIKNKELFLFQIYNKDFSQNKRNKKAKDNLHTSYFKLLFDAENLKDTVLKLNGQAEMFYRKAFTKDPVIHSKNKPIAHKRDKNKKSRFEYDIIKDKRFTQDKFFFHVPISLNFKNGNTKSFNKEVLSFLKEHNKNINIIGLDRGERHLAYYTVINQNREILKQNSFNIITNTYKDKNNKTRTVSTDYHKLLETREQSRDKARKTWTKIENIKNLKSGYLSHLVHQLSELMIKHNAIIVFEDLNWGFKKGRMKFEKQVYQKLEKALIDKLNYLVFKERKTLEAGGYLRAYQLTAPVESFQKMGKQTGFIFYVSAPYTSKVCPLTGFANLIYPRYENVRKSKDFFSKFDKIYFESQKGYFVFKYQNGKVNPNKKSESNKTWTVCSHGRERYKYKSKKRKHEKVNITEELKKLFKEYKINYEGGQDLKTAICSQDEKKFWHKLTDGFKLTLQLRHTNPSAEEDKDKDFILSPVPDKNGRFFDSREARAEEPKNADANGAYHIALKGLLLLKKNNEGKNLKITNKEWFNFIQKEQQSKTSKAG